MEQINRALVVMLHGWAQNATVFRRRTRTLTKKLSANGIECLFLCGPIALPPILVVSRQERDGLETSTTKSDASQKLGRQDARAWFLYKRNEDPTGSNDSGYWQSGKQIEYVGLDNSLSYLEGELTRISPEVRNISLLGFSQGAVFSHIIASLATSRGWPWNRIQSCILIGGFCAAPLHWREEELSDLPLRSLHVIGSNDIRVPSALSNKLAERFENAVIFAHDKGHVVPQQTASCMAIVAFIQTSNNTAL